MPLTSHWSRIRLENRNEIGFGAFAGAMSDPTRCQAWPDHQERLAHTDRAARCCGLRHLIQAGQKSFGKDNSPVTLW